jgi:hypothetical protein
VSISGFTISDDIKINGKLTMGEDVADLGGTLPVLIAWGGRLTRERTRDELGLVRISDSLSARRSGRAGENGRKTKE